MVATTFNWPVKHSELNVLNTRIFTGILKDASATSLEILRLLISRNAQTLIRAFLGSI